MSFGESMFSAGFNQKTAKEDLIVKGNHGIPPWYRCGKILEGRGKILEGTEGKSPKQGLTHCPIGPAGL